MYNLRYSQKSFYKIDTFINSYKNTFKKIYSDTGIFDQQKIINNYIEVGNILYSNILGKLKLILNEDNILGQYIREDNKKYVIISVNNFRLFVYYKESSTLKERYIEDIEIFRK